MIKLCNENVGMKFFITLVLISVINTIAQQPEINDQFETTVPPQNNTLTTNDVLKANVTIEEKEIATGDRRNEVTNTTINVAVVPSIQTKFYRAIYAPIYAFFSAPKVCNILRNIGTCMVNGAMELISFYLPAPFIPLIASAAGMIIPFEPVVTLRNKMPVNSYHKAFMSAINTFLGTFDKYKISDNFEDDPYMIERFNRRFMNDRSDEIKKKIKID